MVRPAEWSVAQQLHDLQLVVEVEVVERFVEQQDGRLLGQGLSDEGSLALAARELGDEAPGQGGHAGRRQRRGHGFAVGRAAAARPRAAAGPLGVAAHGDHLLNSEAEVEGEALRDDAHPAGKLAGAVAGDGRPSSRTSPARGPDRPGEGAEQRGLARAVGAEDADEEPRRHLQVEGAEHRAPAKVDLEGADVVDGRACISHPLARAQEVQEEGTAGGGGDDAHRDLRRGYDGAGHGVGQQGAEARRRGRWPGADGDGRGPPADA